MLWLPAVMILLLSLARTAAPSDLAFESRFEITPGEIAAVDSAFMSSLTFHEDAGWWYQNGNLVQHRGRVIVRIRFDMTADEVFDSLASSQVAQEIDCRRDTTLCVPNDGLYAVLHDTLVDPSQAVAAIYGTGLFTRAFAHASCGRLPVPAEKTVEWVADVPANDFRIQIHVVGAYECVDGQWRKVDYWNLILPGKCYGRIHPALDVNEALDSLFLTSVARIDEFTFRDYIGDDQDVGFSYPEDMSPPDVVWALWDTGLFSHVSASHSGQEYVTAVLAPSDIPDVGINVHPNPGNASFTVGFRTDADANVRLAIYDILGQCVRTLAERRMEAGSHSVVWDGADERGRAVASGVYVVRLETDLTSLATVVTVIR